MAKTQRVPKPEPKPFAFQWREHDGDHVRVWRTDWFGDQFEVVTRDRFAEIESVCKQFAIRLTEADD
jgi:hypothetical protein